MTMLIRLRACLCAALPASGMAAASEATLKREMEKKYPGVPVHSVTKSPMPGIYEVFVNGQIVYTDENVTYPIVRGRLIDVALRRFWRSASGRRSPGRRRCFLPTVSG